MEEALTLLKGMIDEENYPYFDDEYLIRILLETTVDTDGTIDLKPAAKKLCLIKAGIEEIKLGDVTIPSPRNHFLMLASGLRNNMTGQVVRADER